METREITLEDGTTKQGFLIYSLGNFVSGQVKQYTNHSIILNLKLTKHSEGNITIDEVKYVPIYVVTKTNSVNGRFKILDIEKSIKAYEEGTDSSISKTLYEKLVSAKTFTDKILKGEIK